MDLLNTALSIMLSLPTIIFGIVIYITTLIIRRSGDAASSFIGSKIPEKYKKYVHWLSHLWGDWVLPGLPIILGVIATGLIEQFPYPEALGSGKVLHIFYGVVVGAFSGYIYRGAKAFFKKVLPQKEEEQISGVLNKIEENK